MTEKNSRLATLKEKFFGIFERATVLSALLALYVTSALTVALFPKSHLSITSFNKIIGIAALNDYDVGKLILLFYGYFLFIAVLFCGALFFFSRIEKALTQSNEHIVEGLKELVSLGLVINILQAIGIGSGRISFGMLAFFIAFVATLELLRRNRSIEEIIQILIAGFSLMIPIGIVFSMVISRAMVVNLGALLFSLLLCSYSFRRLERGFTNNLTAIFSGLPLLTFLFIEVLHISASHGVVLGRPLFVYVILTGVIFFLFGFLSQKRKIDIGLDKSAMLSLLGIALLMTQCGFYFWGDADIFESANSSILISDFLNFGTLPIVSHYGGHMLGGAIEGIFYGLISGDHYGAIFGSAYGGYLMRPCYALLLYWLVRRLFNSPTTAFLFALFFPFDWTISYFVLGLLVAFSVAHFATEDSRKSTILLFLAMIACCLYRLDLGYSFVLAALVSILWFAFLRIRSLRKTTFWIPAAEVVFVVLIIWCVLCWLEGANPILRLFEFLAISASNANWAYTTLGNRNLFAFSFSYILMPIASVLALLWVLGKREHYEKTNLYVTCVLLVLGLAYFTNFTRGLVRHSVAEVAMHCTIWCGYLFLACVVGIFLKKKWLIFPVLFALLVTNGLVRNNSAYNARPMIQFATQNSFNITRGWIAKEGNGRTFMQNLKSGVHGRTRLIVNPQLASNIEIWKGFFDRVLSEKETYLDFSNHSFIYSAIGRRNPVYAAQSPGHLSGDFSQEMFVREAKAQKELIPLALLPGKDWHLSASLDGVKNVIRYYKVAEYIYQNYRPLAALKDYRVWVLKERYDEFVAKLFPKDSLENTPQDKIRVLLSKKPQAINCGLEERDGRLVVNGMTNDPILDNFQESVGLASFVGRKIQIHIRYKSSKVGTIQLFYANAQGEQYSEASSLRNNGAYEGEVVFELPKVVTANTRVRLDPPAYSVFEITSVTLEECHEVTRIDYGYDQMIPAFHRYDLNQLPRIWGDLGMPKTQEEKVELNRSSDSYNIIPSAATDKSKGNYIVLAIDSQNDGNNNGTELIAKSPDGIERFRFAFTLEKGSHSYAFRVSSDYWWYVEKVSFELKSCSPFKLKSARLLRGD